MIALEKQKQLDAKTLQNNIKITAFLPKVYLKLNR